MVTEAGLTSRQFRRADWNYGQALLPIGEPATSAPGRISHNGVVVPRLMNDALSSEQCDEVLTLAKSIKPARSSVLYSEVNSRNADSHWILPDAEWLWLYERVAAMFIEVNRSFQFQVSHFVDPLLVAVYPVGPGFNWHLDTATGVTSTRKISLTLPLSSGSDYEGGDLEIAPFGIDASARKKGSATFFPSFLCHRVTPIRKGKRAVLVAWAHGPAFS